MRGIYANQIVLMEGDGDNNNVQENVKANTKICEDLSFDRNKSRMQMIARKLEQIWVEYVERKKH